MGVLDTLQTENTNFNKKYGSLGGYSNPSQFLTGNNSVEEFSPIPGYSPSGNNTDFLTIPGMNDSYGGVSTDFFGKDGIFSSLGGLSGIGDLLGGGAQIFGALNARDQLDESKRQAGIAEQYASLNAYNQGSQVNTGLRDRQLARVASQGLPQGDPGKYQSVSSYMDQNRVKTGIA